MNLQQRKKELEVSGSTSTNTQVTTICAKELLGEAGCKELCDECKGKRDRFAAVSTEAEGWKKQELISNEGWKVKLQFSPTVPKAVQDKFLELIADHLLPAPPTVNKMRDSKLTAEWQEYDGDYEKRIQDIRTKDGKEYFKCWPNAGKWMVLSHKTGIEIKNSEVTHVKLNKEELE